MIPQDLLNKKRPKKNNQIYEYLYIEEYFPEKKPENEIVMPTTKDENDIKILPVLDNKSEPK